MVTTSLAGSAGSTRAERAGVARDAGIDLAVGRAHREVVDRALRHAFLHRHLRRGVVRRADDEVSVGIGGRHRAVGQLFRRDISRRVRIARRRGGAWRGRRLRRRRRRRWCPTRDLDGRGSAGHHAGDDDEGHLCRCHFVWICFVDGTLRRRCHSGCEDCRGCEAAAIIERRNAPRAAMPHPSFSARRASHPCRWCRASFDCRYGSRRWRLDGCGAR